jgi:putative Holliday junction resolvase
MKVLALDVGNRRTGVAISDPTGTLARSLAVLVRKHGHFQEVTDMVASNGVERIVVGYPRNMDGSIGEQARRVDAYVSELQQHVDVPVELWDERLSTAEAERLLIESGRSAKKRRGRVDAVAAAVILQDYLDAAKRREIT